MKRILLIFALTIFSCLKSNPLINLMHSGQKIIQDQREKFIKKPITHSLKIGGITLGTAVGAYYGIKYTPLLVGFAAQLPNFFKLYVFSHYLKDAINHVSTDTIFKHLEQSFNKNHEEILKMSAGY